MKTKNILFVILTAIIMVSQSCTKDEDDTEVQTGLSSDESAELIAASCCEEAYGYVEQVNDMVEFAAEGDSTQANPLFDTTFQVTSDPDAYFQYSYLISYEYGWQTSGGEDDFYLNFESAGSYETPHITSDDAGTGSFTLGNLYNEQSHYVINGTASRQGSQQINIMQERNYTSTIESAFQNIRVNKDSFEIEDGECDVLITGTTSSGYGFTLEGTLQFNGDGTITLTIGGKIYQIDSTTGEIL